MNGRGVTLRDDEHLGERAELYALGVLDAGEADRVNAHAARCAECSRLVGDAERVVARLDAATVVDVAPPAGLAERVAAIARAEAPRRLGARSVTGIVRWGALAAALLLAFGGVAGTRGVLHMRDVVAQDDAAMAVVANSHFKHATLTKVDVGAPTAKVLWGLTNRWVYVIVDSPSCACRVVAVTDAGERDLGMPLASGATAVAFANDLPRVRRVELRRDGKAIEAIVLR